MCVCVICFFSCREVFWRLSTSSQAKQNVLFVYCYMPTPTTSGRVCVCVLLISFKRGGGLKGGICIMVLFAFRVCYIDRLYMVVVVVGRTTTTTLFFFFLAIYIGYTQGYPSTNPISLLEREERLRSIDKFVISAI